MSRSVRTLVVAMLALLLVASAPAHPPLCRIEGRVLERADPEYVVVEGTAVPLHGSGGLPAGSLIVVIRPDPKAAPGPGTDYLGYAVYAGRIRGIASNDIELPAFRAVDLFLIEGRRFPPRGHGASAPLPRFGKAGPARTELARDAR